MGVYQVCKTLLIDVKRSAYLCFNKRRTAFSPTSISREGKSTPVCKFKSRSNTKFFNLCSKIPRRVSPWECRSIYLLLVSVKDPYLLVQ